MINNNPIGMKKFFNSLNLTYCPYLTFDSNDLYTQRYIQKIIDLKEQDVINKNLYSGQINYKGYVEKKKPLLKIDYISEQIGYGVFAEQEFNQGDFIGEFCGTVTSNYDESSKNYNYKYFSAINEEENIFIAPRKTGNELQFVNHSNNPNVEWKTIVGNDNKYHVIMIAIKHIKKGDQILVDYGKEYWETLGINPLEFT
jgi:hypothetical protein